MYFVSSSPVAAFPVWVPANGAEKTHFVTDKAVSYSGIASSQAPTAITDIMGDIIFGLVLSAEVVNGANSDIVLDGSATVTLNII